MTAASGKTTVPGTVRGSTGTATTTMTIGMKRGGFAAARRASARAMQTVATMTGRDSDHRSVADRRPSPHGAIAMIGVTTVTGAPDRSSAEGRAVSCTMATAATIVADDDLGLRSAADRRRLRRVMAADRLVVDRRPSRSAVVRTGGRASSAAMEAAAHSPGVVGLVSAVSVVTASAAGTTVRASALDHSRTAVDLQPLTGDREAAGEGPATTTMTLAVDAGGVTAIDTLMN